MNEPIKRAVKAIQNKLCNMDEPHDRCALIATDAQAEQIVRAVIEAMREPTQAMIDACSIDIPTEGMITGVWDDMIEAALK